MARTPARQVQYLNDVLARIAAQPDVPKSLEEHLEAGKAVQAALRSAIVNVEKAEEKRNGSLAQVGSKDSALDAGLEELATECVGAKVGTRAAPFGRFTKLTPGKLKVLGYKAEAEACIALVADVLAGVQAEDVVKAAGAVLQRANDVKAAIEAITVPNTEYAQALLARDEAYVQHQRAVLVLEKHVQAAWARQAGIAKAILADSDRIAAPVRKRAKRTGGEKPAPQPMPS